MLIFLDESGDIGWRTDRGSSRYFLICIVLFADNEEAQACDQRINLLRKELHKTEDYEFHFADNSHKVRIAFLESIFKYNFSYLCVAINKEPELATGIDFSTKESFYSYVCNMVFTNALPYLDKATVVLDKSGTATFQTELKKYLRIRLDDPNSQKIRKIKQQSSHKNNLLQLADYTVGVLNRKVLKKRGWKDYYKYVNSKELGFQEWPKK